jgi:chromosome segregation ATPase
MIPQPVSPSAPRAAEDLEATAELPILDPAGTAVAEEAVARTDTWAAPAEQPAAPAETTDPAAVQSLDLDSRALSAAMREIQERLANKNERLRQLEEERDGERAARASAEQRTAELAGQVAQLEAAAARAAAQLAEATQSRTTAEERAARLQEEQARAQAAAEHRGEQLNNDLTQALSLASAANARAAQLEQSHEAQWRSVREQHARELAARQALAEGERSRAERAVADLREERVRAANYLEALQTTESRRLISEELAIDLQREIQARENEVAGLTRRLADGAARLRQQEADAARHAARITQLEQQQAALGATLAQRDAQLQESRNEGQGLQHRFARMQAELSASNERVRTLAEQAEQHRIAAARHQEEVQGLHAELARRDAALAAAQSAAATAAAQLDNRQAALAGATERTAQLEAILASERARSAQLESDLQKARSDMEDWGSALRSAEQQRERQLSALTAAEARVQELEQQAAQQLASTQALQVQADANAAHVPELEAQLRRSQESVERLESEARNQTARIATLEKAMQMWRSALEDMRLNSSDSRPRPMLHEATQRIDEEAASPAPPAPDGQLRLLIQVEKGHEVVHVLGRKTSIGRQPENDVQIEAKHVSRQHAVILAGPTQTIIEDLNSTNGVHVNGRRVTRQSLRDGDLVAIGRTQFRFALRKSGEKR